MSVFKACGEQQGLSSQSLGHTDKALATQSSALAPMGLEIGIQAEGTED